MSNDTIIMVGVAIMLTAPIWPYLGAKADMRRHRREQALKDIAEGQGRFHNLRDIVSGARDHA